MTTTTTAAAGPRGHEVTVMNGQHQQCRHAHHASLVVQSSASSNNVHVRRPEFGSASALTTVVEDNERTLKNGVGRMFESSVTRPERAAVIGNAVVSSLTAGEDVTGVCAKDGTRTILTILWRFLFCFVFFFLINS
jgi:hypothetical protein